jgi:Ca-activated chloride channel family protein
MQIFEGIKLAQSWGPWLLALIIPYIAARIFLRRKRAVEYSPLFYGRSLVRGRFLSYLPLFIEAVIITLLVAAFTGPYRENSRELVSDKGVDIALALDVSASMQAADFRPNRLEAMKKISTEFIKKSGSNRMAVFVFAKHTFTQTPLTTSHSVLIELIDGIAYEMIDHVKSGGTAIGDVLLMAAEGLTGSRREGRDQAIILVTDGESNEGVDPLLGARLIKERNIRLYVIGVGGKKPVEVYVYGKPFINRNNQVLTTQLDDTQLKEIAVAAEGSYFRAENNDVLSGVLEEISRLEATPLDTRTLVTRSYYRPELGLLIFILFSLYMTVEGIFFRRPYR